MWGSFVVQYKKGGANIKKNQVKCKKNQDMQLKKNGTDVKKAGLRSPYTTGAIYCTCTVLYSTVQYSTLCSKQAEVQTPTMRTNLIKKLLSKF